jgi:two-component system response regulator GlrR
MGLTEASTEATATDNRPTGRRREDRIVGASQANRDLIEQATAAARSDLPVLIMGPPGGDKISVARAIHEWGRRANRTFEHLSCVSIPEALQGREVFGCAEGVYPAVPGDYAGALDRAGNGTLLLERSEGLTPSARASLSKATADGVYRREGANAARPLSARVVATIDSGSDASVFGSTPHHTIRIAPLSERNEDILPLAVHYLAVFAEEAGFQPVGFTADARACLLTEPWTGDALELRERVRQAVRLAGGGAIGAEALMLAADADEVPSFKEAKRAFETRYVTGLLRRCGGNISRAARLAKKDRKDFYDVIRRTGVDPSEFRASRSRA